ncbi:STAS domain-containing protein [Streptomyces sp. NPDC090106]|uniref:STAS domain-containing protein n=1 Tax=Streptomyces sp. NPDC090106 TaxID=3365946 RepID=UPI00381FC249
MSDLSPVDFTLTVLREPATLVVRVSGELDYDTSDDLVATVTEHLTAPGTPPRAVRLDFTGLTLIDSSGLSALLMVHRRTRALGAALHLDNRPVMLERMLQMTNILDHLLSCGSEGSVPAHDGLPAGSPSEQVG